LLKVSFCSAQLSGVVDCGSYCQSVATRSCRDQVSQRAFGGGRATGGAGEFFSRVRPPGFRRISKSRPVHAIRSFSFAGRQCPLQGQLQKTARAQTESRGSHEDLQLRGAGVLYRCLRAAIRKTRQAKRRTRIDPRLDPWRSPSSRSKVPPSAKSPSTVGDLAHWVSLPRIMIFRKPQGPGKESADD
jgi:hypothetical protein